MTRDIHLKYELLNLPVREKTDKGWVKSTYPEGVDGKKVMDLGGKVCILLMGFEQLALGNRRLPCKFDEGSGKTVMTASLEEFLGFVKDNVFECVEYLNGIKNSQA